MKGRSGGSIYRRPGTAMLWLKFYDADGKPVRMSAETASEDDAKRVLAIEIAKVAKGEPVGLKPARVKVGDLLDDLVNDYTVNGQVLNAIKPGVARLRQAFGSRRAHDLTTAALR